MKTCLIFCRTLTALSILKRLDFALPVVVASDDPMVQSCAKNIRGVKEVAFIESSESFWTVASDVKEIIGKIDEWLYSLSPGMEKELLSWGLNVEGGFTGQRVQDALLLIRSYLHLFSAFKVAEVHAIDSPGSEWEDKILSACAKSKGLPLERHASQRLACWRQSWENRLIPFAKSIYQILHEFIIGRVRFKKSESKIELDGAILFQLCGALQKHVDNIKFVMSALVKRGLRPICICWSANSRITGSTPKKLLSKSGIPTIDLEKFVFASDVFDSLIQSGIIFYRARKLKGKLSHLRYQNVSLTPILNVSFAYFFIAMLPQRIRYERALRACLLNSKPAAIKLWGGSEFFEGNLLLRLQANDVRPIFIHYFLGVSLPEWPYNNRIYKPDLFLAKSQFEAEIAVKEFGVTKNQVEVVGGARFDHLRKFSEQNSVKKSRYTLSLPLDKGLYIGLDPGGPLKGYNSYREQLELTRTLLRAAEQSPDLAIAIKPHPSYRIDHLLPIINGYRCSNIYILNKNSAVTHFLNSIDILITKYSTLILEAALMNRCTIAAILDREKRFKVFGNMPVTFSTAEDLFDLIVQLASDRNAFLRWKKVQLTHQNNLLPRYYFKCNDSAALAADKIQQTLSAFT